MKPRTILAAALAAAVMLPQAAHSQMEMPELGPISSVATWELNPADLGAFMEVTAKVVEAAKQANLSDEYGWTMWQNMYTITVVGSFNAAEIEDPQHWMKQFMGTPGETTLMEAFQEFGNITLLSMQNELMQGMPGWSYTPEGMTNSEPAWVHVYEFWLRGGLENEQKFDALMGEFRDFFKEIGYPYEIFAIMTRYGDSRVLFVTPYEDQGTFYGANSVETLAEKHGMSARWQELIGQMSLLTMRAEQSDHQFLPAQSYSSGM